MSTLLTTAGAIDRCAVMRRAWDLMKIEYGFGRIPFRSIGRTCFGWCLRKAWSEVRDEIARRAIPAEVLADRIASLEEELSNLVYIDDWRHVERRTREINDAIRRLAA